MSYVLKFNLHFIFPISFRIIVSKNKITVALKDIIIKRNIKKSVRKAQFFNYETAKSVGVLYCIDNKTNFDRIKQYVSDLSGKNLKVHALGFVKKPDDIGKTYFGQGNFNFFSEKHINKIGKIKEICISDFINADIDIIINFTTSNNLYLEYLFALSKAKFKVSGIIDCKYSDLNINYDRSKDLDYFISQIEHYLSTIKKA